MKLLVLGGTKFLGRAVVECALARDHEVTLFNRGRTNPGLFPEAERLAGDREQDLRVLTGREWDAVVDPSGYVPGVVRRSVELLRDLVGHYVFVSSVSVYADGSGPWQEDGALVELEPGQSSEALSEDYANYGALKALCEDVVAEALPGRHASIRAGLIVGPHDPTGRFTYWPHRAARGGEMLVPGPAEREVQFVDVRDLAGWIVSLCEERVDGTFNATRPGVSWRELVEACVRLGGGRARPVWVSDRFLVEQGVGEWMELPLWLRDPQSADVSRARAAGLTFRPLAESVRAALERAEPTPTAGLAPERETTLLERWRNR